MKSKKAIFLLAALPIFLASCGGDEPSSSSAAPSSSEEPESSSSSSESWHGSGSNYQHMTVGLYGSRYTSSDEGLSYSATSSSWTVKMEKNEATGDLVNGTSSFTLPAGAKLTVTLLKSEDHFASTHGTASTGITFASDIDVSALSFAETSITATASGAKAVLSFADKATKTITMTSTSELELVSLTLCYGYETSF